MEQSSTNEPTQQPQLLWRCKWHLSWASVHTQVTRCMLKITQMLFKEWWLSLQQTGEIQPTHVSCSQHCVYHAHSSVAIQSRPLKHSCLVFFHLNILYINRTWWKSVSTLYCTIKLCQFPFFPGLTFCKFGTKYTWGSIHSSRVQWNKTHHYDMYGDNISVVHLMIRMSCFSNKNIHSHKLVIYKCLYFCIRKLKWYIFFSLKALVPFIHQKKKKKKKKKIKTCLKC